MSVGDYLLTCLSEECAEVIQQVCKAKRFGLDTIAPNGVSNAELIVAELNDVLAIIEMLSAADFDVSTLGDVSAIEAKKEKVLLMMKISATKGQSGLEEPISLTEKEEANVN